ncbi:hypothetical protein V8C37DRAFT_402299 [Trichoderma ceciliae]
MKRFVDDIAVEVIEVHLVSILGDMLSPSKVYKIDPTLVRVVTGESEEYRALREQLKQQLEVLSKGAETCRPFVGVKFSDDTCEEFEHLALDQEDAASTPPTLDALALEMSLSHRGCT